MQPEMLCEKHVTLIVWPLAEVTAVSFICTIGGLFCCLLLYLTRRNGKAGKMAEGAAHA